MMRTWLLILMLTALLGGGGGCKWRAVTVYDVTCLPWRCIANARDGNGLGYTISSPLFVRWREGQTVAVKVCR